MISKIQQANSTLVIAIACAVVVHVSLLLIKIGINNDVNFPASEPLTIQLQKTTEPPAEPTIEEVKVSAAKLKEPVKEVETRTIEIAAEKQNAVIDSKPIDQQATTATIINSTQYKQWIKSETINHIEKNPNALAGFADSFVLPGEETTANSEIEISPLGTGMTKVVRNGKVICQLQTVLPFNNSFSNSSFMTYKDCTPPNKFVLNIK